ncbi:MAG: winged helix-turn-helix domain-containing protein [Pseudomonadota bacterium]
MDETRFGSHVLQPHRQLLKDEKRVALGPRALAIISVLASRMGEVVKKEELRDAVWPTYIVEENALQVHIASLRKALGEDAALLETIRGVGYELKAALLLTEQGEVAPASVRRQRL